MRCLRLPGALCRAVLWRSSHTPAWSGRLLCLLCTQAHLGTHRPSQVVYPLSWEATLPERDLMGRTRTPAPCERRGDGSRCQSALRSSWGSGGRGGCPRSACPQHPLEPCSWWDLETSPLQRLLPVFPEGLACTAGAGGSGDAETEVSCAQSYKDMAASRDWGQGVCECDGGSGGERH